MGAPEAGAVYQRLSGPCFLFALSRGPHTKDVLPSLWPCTSPCGPMSRLPRTPDTSFGLLRLEF
eukprot:14663314-Heterocapsa_arctica.AAC.1